MGRTVVSAEVRYFAESSLRNYTWFRENQKEGGNFTLQVTNSFQTVFIPNKKLDKIFVFFYFFFYQWERVSLRTIHLLSLSWKLLLHTIQLTRKSTSKLALHSFSFLGWSGTRHGIICYIDASHPPSLSLNFVVFLSVFLFSGLMPLRPGDYRLLAKLLPTGGHGSIAQRHDGFQLWTPACCIHGWH